MSCFRKNKKKKQKKHSPCFVLHKKKWKFALVDSDVRYFRKKIPPLQPCKTLARWTAVSRAAGRLFTFPCQKFSKTFPLVKLEWAFTGLSSLRVGTDRGSPHKEQLEAHHPRHWRHPHLLVVAHTRISCFLQSPFNEKSVPRRRPMIAAGGGGPQYGFWNRRN